MDGRLSIVGNDILCELVNDATQNSATTARIPLNEQSLDQLNGWTDTYRTAVRQHNPLPLYELGRAIFDWLDGTGWATTWAKGTGPRTLEIAVDETETPQAVALLDLPWELLAQRRERNDGSSGMGDFLTGDPAQPFVIFRSVNRGHNAMPQEPEHSELALMFMAASPRGQRELDYEAEEAAILEATERLRMQLVVEESGAAGFLREWLAQDGPFDALHLSCHGTIWRGEPVLLLERPEGNQALTNPGEIATVMGERQCSLLFLSVCRTAETATQVGREDEATGAIAESFVRALIQR